MQKKFRLLKDTPDTKAGTILVYTDNITGKGYKYLNSNDVSFQYDVEDVENNPEWFEEVKVDYTNEIGEEFSLGDSTFWVIKSKGDIYWKYYYELPLNHLHIMLLNQKDSIYKIFSTEKLAYHFCSKYREEKVKYTKLINTPTLSIKDISDWAATGSPKSNIFITDLNNLIQIAKQKFNNV